MESGVVMKSRQLLTPALLSIVMVATASGGITFGPVRAQPGESVHLLTHTEAPGGTLQKTTNGKSNSGTITMSRDRDLVWTFRAPAADGTRRGMVRVNNLSTSTVTMMHGGKAEKTNDISPLNGKMFAMSKTPRGEWKFELDGSVPYSRIQTEIDELVIYLKRNWYPDREVNVGDSWEFDPAWVKMIIRKDLTNAQTIGTMKLRQVRTSANRRIAVIDITIHSTGADFQSDGSEAQASIELTGQTVVNLETMLDESLELKGTLTTSSNKDGQSTKVKLPLKVVANKSFTHEITNP